MSQHPTSTAPLRRLVNGVALILAAITAIGIPAGYLVVAHTTTGQYLSFRAKYDGAAVARYIYSHERMWQFHAVRLAELLERDRVVDEEVTSRVLDATGATVINVGATPNWPTMTRSEPLLVSGRTMGRVEVETSIRAQLAASALVTVLSLLLGFAMYFAVRVLPLKMLDRTLGDLEKTNRRFDAALANMSQGLCMYDREQRLLVSNERYADMYDLEASAVRPGAKLSEIVRMRIANGTYPGEAPEYVVLPVAGKEVEPVDTEVSLADGRTIRVVRRLMNDGSGWVATHDDVTQRIEQQARIAYLANHDALTGLPNRRRFRDELTATLRRMPRDAGRMAVLCLDLDHFKAVNDTLGHPVGDALLQEVSRRLNHAVRTEDIVARQGGDEFAIVQVGGDQPSAAVSLAERLIEEISRPYVIDEHSIAISLSVGIAMAPDDSTDADQLLKAGDLALYRAKADGRGTYRFFEPGMDARAQARRILELDLRAALAAGEFELYYQPIVDIQSHQVVTFEALIRWHHPRRGIVPPNLFIPLAEETGLIVPLGEWVLRQACADAAGWSRPVNVAVNLSAVQFKSNRLIQAVREAVMAAGIEPGRLELEITESVLLNDNVATLATLHALRAFGARVSMDDFGTGYSSLSYIRSFPFDKIKIDQSFVRDLATRHDSMAIVRAITGLANGLGITTTAEGVETADQVRLLRREGCTQAQGYVVSPPRPVGEVEKLLGTPGAARAGFGLRVVGGDAQA